MKQFIFIFLAILGLTSNTVSYAEEQSKSISSACDDNLFGTWTLVSESTSLDHNKIASPLPMTHQFNRAGMTNLIIDPFLDVTTPYVCNGSKLIIQKTVPSYLNIIRLDATEMVYLEEGTEQYFYFEK
ncbi:hypothetical protein [Pleurocapsa sp. PCC 7319]|uniref:hypothetical protein n=1 Tax=Pleurocapsa sp. PCC 7319 TaxID=118161 RepID=UPI000347C677|nr:hypothetical protein [Pleurocapsa sp. PCC 7319]